MPERTVTWRTPAAASWSHADALEPGARTDEDPAELVSEDGRVWHLDRWIGKGGQGRVYTLVEGPLVVKLLEEPDDAGRAALRERLASVQRLPLDGLPIARPLVQLCAPHAGYVMRLVDDVAPLAHLSEPPHGEDATRWYAQTGGVRRRLRLLARLADVLDRLHGQAVVYGDLSLENVLVSTSPDHHEVWLIDPDNLRYTSVEGSWICTRLFGAPEQQTRGSTPTTLTDAHALAVVAYRTLTGGHPLLDGALVQADAEQLEPALYGRLPWIDHPERRENARVRGVAPEAVLSRRLLALARETFERGLLEPGQRARAGAWAAELAWAADLCVACPACEHNYLASGTRVCRWCAAPRPRLALVSIGVCDEQGGVHLAKRSPHLAAPEGEPLQLTRRHAFGERDFATQHELAGTLRLIGEQALFEPALAGATLATPGGLRALSPGEHVELPATPGATDTWAIHFGEPGTLHRLARLQVLPEERP